MNLTTAQEGLSPCLWERTMPEDGLMYGDRNGLPIISGLTYHNIEPSHKLTLLTHSSFTIGVYSYRERIYSVFFRSEGNTVNSYMLAIFGSPIPYVTYNIKF